MDPQLTGAEASVCGARAAEHAPALQQELVAAMYRAFEVALKLAVGEVERLVGDTARDPCEELRRENESLRARLHRAEAMLEGAEGGPPRGRREFRCQQCNREFTRRGNLQTHLRIHTGERPYTCSVCAKCFRHSGTLTRHLRTHAGEKPYTSHSMQLQ